MSTRLEWAISCGLVLAIVAGVRLGAQTQFARGQDVAPVFEGWELNSDGTYSMVFGYLNRNYQEEVDIPIGPNNTIDLGDNFGGDRGQPTHFYPRRQRFVFKVVVPRDWDKDRRVVWTLISRGKTNQAKGWLQPEWELNDGVIAENSGGGLPDPNNKPPTITGSPDQTITLPSIATLTVSAVDDGLPKTRPGRVSVATSVPNPDAPSESLRQGVRIKWILYRGPGKVAFDPDTTSLEYGKPVTLTSTVSFSVPGTYVLRATASDGQLFANYHVTVMVNPDASVGK
jgi:hypothetical protein